MSKREYRLYLEDILTSIEKIEKYTEGLSLEDFNNDGKTLDAVVRNFEIIGEAARNIPPEIKINSPEIPWRKISDTRNRVLHEYFGIDTDILWKAIYENLPPLKEQIKKLLES